jgi:hypothetical protein
MWESNTLSTWKFQKENPYVTILNKQKCLFSKMKDRIVKQFLSGVGISGREENISKG